mmetsp:Transcript_41536/g.109960  ORF Transcript_41536/g.109960 Transcript_41536/m.109960 type:complete len:203 (+) Transcript_41536:192-800(+)
MCHIPRHALQRPRRNCDSRRNSLPSHVQETRSDMVCHQHHISRGRHRPHNPKSKPFRPLRDTGRACFHKRWSELAALTEEQEAQASVAQAHVRPDRAGHTRHCREQKPRPEEPNQRWRSLDAVPAEVDAVPNATPWSQAEGVHRHPLEWDVQARFHTSALMLAPLGRSRENRLQVQPSASVSSAWPTFELPVIHTSVETVKT